MLASKVGPRMAKFMAQNDMSIETLAERTGLSITLLTSIRDDEVYPSLGPLVKITRALGVRLGTFLDDTAMLVIVAPLYVPLVRELGFDLIWYGVLYTITTQIAYMTPPFGYNLFLMKAMAPKEVTLADIYRSIIPFVLVMMIGLGIVMLFPGIALWLPDLYFGR